MLGSEPIRDPGFINPTTYNSSSDCTLTTYIMWFNFCSDIVFFRGHDDKYRLIGPSSIVACDFLDSRTNIYDLANNV